MEYLLFVFFVMMVAFTVYSVSISQGKGKYLCEDCRFNDAEKCLKPERPEAVLCTSYRSESQPVSESEYKK